MAAAPAYKVYDADGQYVAAVKEIQAGACLMDWYGQGATIRHGHTQVVWKEGAEDQPARDSYDHVALVAQERIRAPKAVRR